MTRREVVATLVMSIVVTGAAAVAASGGSPQRPPFSSFAGASVARDASSASSAAAQGDFGDLQQFAPRSATTWWAVVANNFTGRSKVVRTTDGGRHWRDLRPPVKIVGSSSFVGNDTAWIEAGALHPPRFEPVYRTLDGGRTWRRLANVPDGCELDFVDGRDGWCAWIGAALGSSGVRLYRTSNGGSSWTLVSRTNLVGGSSTPGSLPSACDKAVTFTSPTVGWATSACAFWPPFIYRSTDGGAHWNALARIPRPAAMSKPEDGGLHAPTVDGADVTLAVDVCCGVRGTTAIVTSDDGGRSWRTISVPGPLGYRSTALIDARQWRVTDGSRVSATDDGGKTWRTWTPDARLKDEVGSPLNLMFLTPSLGFAVPDGNGGQLQQTSDGGMTWKPVKIRTGHFTLPLGSVLLPGLPAQGLIVPAGRGVALIGLDGRIVARLPHFTSYAGGDTAHDQVMHGLDWAGQLEQPRLVTNGDRYYRLDASLHALIPVPEPRVPLVGGAELVAHSHVDASGEIAFTGLSVVRSGHVLVRRDVNATVVAGMFVQSRGRLLDVRAGVSWRLPPRCIGVGARGNVAYAFCATGPPDRYPGGIEPYPHMWLERVTHRAGSRKVAEFSRDGPFPRVIGALSPNGHFVADQGEPTCGGGYLFVGSTDGSLDARLVSGDAWTNSSPNSTFLGWAADGRIVAHIQSGNCERPSKQGIYLVDPLTLKRTYVTRNAWDMWNAFP
jgi:photosystem II stability/assembly factor-like uncharacterized protein